MQGYSIQRTHLTLELRRVLIRAGIAPSQLLHGVSVGCSKIRTHVATGGKIDLHDQKVPATDHASIQISDAVFSYACDRALSAA